MLFVEPKKCEDLDLTDLKFKLKWEAANSYASSEDGFAPRLFAFLGLRAKGKLFIVIVL